MTFSCTEFRVSLVGTVLNGFALESPENIRGIEEIDKELSFQFEDCELQREDEKREEEEAEEQREEEQREEEEAEEQREEEEDVDEQREEDEKPAHRPLKPSLPNQQGFTCSSCLYQETILQHILSVFVVFTKFYELGITVLSSFNRIVCCMWK
jgi:hypothetical protein